MSEDDLTPRQMKRRRRDPEKLRAEKARWYQRHKAEIAAKEKARVAANRGAKRAQLAKWKRENPGVFRLLESKRRARARSADGDLSPGIVQRLLKLQRGKCACCRENLGDDYQLDHIVPLALGGEHSDGNVQLLRRACNARKGAKDPVTYMQANGFLL